MESPADWQQLYWEKHLQNCVHEAAEVALRPTFSGRISSINVSGPFVFLRYSNIQWLIDSQGWGLRAGEHILRGTFVCEYIGEIVDPEEANKRQNRYGKEGCSYVHDIYHSTYLFSI
ncbi:Histone-lysine N-methyltransferase SUVR5 [Cardamine amara subsp. amara]|uniref:Histone-lysine N-methyltransferase SUVR5 n=1 Tax=Cardamine amara subsp. amara TaxID=228776 RepID=A0ABD1ASA4_CARAN